MRRIVCREFGPPEHPGLEVVPDPKPGPGEVLVKVHAAGVSFVDGLIVGGMYQLKPSLPFTDVLGRVAAGALHPVAPQTYPLERTAGALNALAKRQVTGKLALLP